MTSTIISSATPIDPRTGWVLLHKGEEEIYVWAVHAAGWQALGWSMGSAPVKAPEPEPELPLTPSPEPPIEDQPADAPATDPVLAPEVDSAFDRELDAEHNAEVEPGPDAIADPVAAVPDFGAMTKAEIIEHCSRDYGVLLDNSLTKAALVTEAEALAAAAPLPDALVDDLMR
ncbi:hypothetical protein [Synechococcus sp. CBW1108]|uniref:hypothetical protein n=1 Tax=Synechococcus sp. CBW1108 TaxID=1353147 RepID=UPI0018CDC29F|nr:hypothetical protein [Synechococcus sp. CBW1108]QPN68790.1 hypothetical protein H8F27_08735 [Synechococcus sp. CBW1108]